MKEVYMLKQNLNTLISMIDVSWKHNLWEDYYWLSGTIMDGEL